MPASFRSDRQAVGGVHIVLAVLMAFAALEQGCRPSSSGPSPLEVSARGPSIVSVTVSAVEQRPVRRHVSVVGSLFGIEQVTVTPKVEGRIVEITSDVGDRVAPDVVLLRLDPLEYELAVQEAQRSLEQELSRLDLTNMPPEDFDIDALPQVERSRLLTENALRQFERQKSLLATNSSVRQSFEQAETDLKVAMAVLRFSRTEARTTIATIKHREAVLMVAQQKLRETQVKSPLLFVPSQISHDASSVSQRTFVVARRMASVGEMVRAFPSTPVFELVLDDELKLHVMVPERYMAQVRTGLDVDVRVEAYPGETFPGKVARINPTVEPLSRSFDVEVRIPNSDFRLRHGGFAKADVILSASDAARVVPLEAITRFAGVVKVFVVRDELVRAVEVAIGAQGPGWVEVTGDLQAGEMVVTSGQSRLANGTRVAVRDASSEDARPAQ